MRRRSPNNRYLTTIFALAVGLTSAANSASAQRPTRLPPPTAKPPQASLGAGDFDELADSSPAFTGGGVEVVRERYPDGKVKVERQVVLDLTGNYVNHGEWKLLNPAGNVIASGHFDMGKRIGPWVRLHTPKETQSLNQFPFNKFRPPFQSQANFTNDQMDGEWLIVDSAQRKCMQVSLAAGKRNGTSTIWLPNSTIYRQATYDQGVPTGDVLETDPKKGELKRVATYVEGKKITTNTVKGRGKYKKSEEQYLEPATVEQAPDDFWSMTFADYAAEGESMRHGPSKLWFDNGQLQQEGFYQLGKKSGNFTFYYENGQVAATGEYKEDQPEDLWVWWHRNGQKSTVGQYRNGKQVGEWRWWDQNGALASQMNYDEAGGLAADRQEGVETSMAPNMPNLK